MNKKKFLPAMLFFVILLALAGCGAKEAEQEASPEISISEMR